MNNNFNLRLAMFFTVIVAVSINTITCKKSDNSPAAGNTEKSPSSANTASPSSQNKANISPVEAWLKAVEDYDYNKVSSLFDSLTTADIEYLTTEKANPREAFFYDLNASGDGVIIKGINNVYFDMYPTIIVPKSIEDFPVVGITGFVREGQTSLLTVVLPNTIRTLETREYTALFSNYLHKINMPTNLESIKGHVYAKTSLSGELILPESIVELDNGCFADCSEITSISFGNKLETIGTDVFSGCTSLSEIRFLDSIKKIGKFAFNGCTGLSEIRFPDSITEIQENAFSKCTSLSVVNFSDSLTEIKDKAFSETAIKNLLLPINLERIGIESFRDCTSLQSVVFPSTLKSIGAFAFFNCPALVDITIPNDLTIPLRVGEYAFNLCRGLTLVSRKKIQDLGYKGNF
jgi:hypothetical protein